MQIIVLIDLEKTQPEIFPAVLFSTGSLLLLFAASFLRLSLLLLRKKPCFGGVFQMERTNFTTATHPEPHVSREKCRMAEEEPQREVPVPSPHPFSSLEPVSSSLLDLTPEKPPPAARGTRRRSGNRPVQLKQHDFLQNGRSPAGDEAGMRKLNSSWLNVLTCVHVYHCRTLFPPEHTSWVIQPIK